MAPLVPIKEALKILMSL